MKIIIAIAWRNIWRNRTRSLLVSGSIDLGLWAGAFVMAFAWGLYQNNIHDVVYRQYSHLQLHHAQFGPDMAPEALLSRNAAWDKLLREPGLRCATTRLLVSGMVRSSTQAKGMLLYGVQPEEEARQTELKQMLVQGAYFPPSRSQQVLIGEKLAQKLRVKLHQKIVVSFSDTAGNITAAALRITGIYRSRNAALDELRLFTERSTLAGLLNLDSTAFHEAAVLLDDSANLERVQQQLSTTFPGALVQTWKQLKAV